MIQPASRRRSPFTSLFEPALAFVLALLTVAVLQLTLSGTLAALRDLLLVMQSGVDCLGRPSWTC